MQTLTLAAARALGAVVVLTTLGVTISISYTFGSEQYGDGSPVYGVLWASFAAVAAVCTFSLFGSREPRVQIASGIVVALCVLCSGLGSVISLGSRQEQLERAESGRESLYANLALARSALAQIPEHRDTTAIEGEQRLIAEMHRRDPKLKRDTARDLALINELELGRRAAAVKAQGLESWRVPGTPIVIAAMAGMNGLGLPVLLDGMNEKGLVGGLLNAPNTAVYQDVSTADSSTSIASVQMLTYALSNFATVDEVKAGFQKIKINRSTIAAYGNKSAPVRMTLHDAQGKSLVIEYLKGELVMTDNPTGVMTNDPAFRDQLNNIGQYANLTNVEKDPLVINGASYVPPSSGSGLHGLPGDYLSPSRFIRAIFLSKSAPATNTLIQQLNTAWHILGSFDIPPGAISLPASNAYGGGAGGVETTEWTAVADNKNLVYYVKTFANTNVQAFDLKKIDFDAKEVKYYSVDLPQSYIAIN